MLASALSVNNVDARRTRYVNSDASIETMTKVCINDTQFQRKERKVFLENRDLRPRERRTVNGYEVASVSRLVG